MNIMKLNHVLSQKKVHSYRSVRCSDTFVRRCVCYRLLNIMIYMKSQEVHARVHSQYFGVLMSDSPPH